jgi:hypothetical protein
VPLPTWAPTLPDVANYVPRRTVVGAADGYGAPVNTFDTTTHPTATIAGAPDARLFLPAPGAVGRRF